MNTSTYYFGTTRFSVHIPGASQWKSSRGTRDTGYAELLFDDRRMELRTEIFLKLAVPVYAAWSERFRYRHIVHFSSDLPDKWRSALEESARRFPFLLLDEVTDKIDHNAVIARHLSHNGSDVELVARFRVDDDDILASDYLPRLAQYVNPTHDAWAISFGLGIVARHQGRRYSDFRLKYEPRTSAGQANIGRWDAAKQRLATPEFVNGFSHGHVDRHRATIFDAREVMFLRTFHAFQDYQLDTGSPEERRIGRLRPFEDAAVLRAKFPTIVGTAE